MVVLVDEEDRENEGDLVLAADFVTPEKINFMARTRAASSACTLTEDALPRASACRRWSSHNRSVHGTNFTVSIEAAEGVTTGISAADRARTVAGRGRARREAADIVQPGHIFPLMAQPGGVLVRAGHTEAGCDLARARGLTPAAVHLRDHERRRHDGAAARSRSRSRARMASRSARSPTSSTTAAAPSGWSSASPSGRSTTAHGAFRLVVYRDKLSDATHLALVRGPIVAGHRDAGARARAAVGDGPARRRQHVAFVDASRRRSRRSPRRAAASSCCCTGRRARRSCAAARSPPTRRRRRRRSTCATTASARRSCAISTSAGCACWRSRARCRAWPASTSRSPATSSSRGAPAS